MDDVALQIINQYRKCKLAGEKERTLWTRCFEYVNNRVDGELGQWSKEVRDQLKSEGRPIISFNEIKKFVNRVCGAQKSAKMDEKAYPRDEESDPVIADILTDLYKYVKDLNKAEIEIGRAFRNAIICGYGWIKCEWSDELDEMGEISIRSVNPRNVWILGDGESYNIERDRKGLIEELPLDKDELVALFPDKEELIEGLKYDVESIHDDQVAGDNYDPSGIISKDDYWDSDLRKLRVLRRQKFAYRDVAMLQNQQDGKLSEVQPDMADDAASLVTETTGIPHAVVRKKRKYVQVTTVCGPVVLEDRPSTYKHNGFDLIPIFAYTDNGLVTGTVQDLLDPQDEKNKRHSQFIHILGTAAKNSYFGRKGAFDDIDSAKKEMSKTGTIIEVNGDLNQVLKPIESNLQAVPALVNMDTMATQEMKEISGINDASLGIVPEGVKSGRGIQQLQQPAEVMIAELFDNYVVSRRMLALKAISLIQQFYKFERRVRILGDYTRNFIPPNLQQQVAAGLISFQDGMKIVTINKMQGEQKLNDISVGRFDMVIDQVAQNPTMRRAEYFDKLNMKSLGAPVKWSTILETYDGKGKTQMMADALEAEQMMQMMGMMAQLAPQDKSATPNKPVETDIMGNVAGAQQ